MHLIHICFLIKYLSCPGLDGNTKYGQKNSIRMPPRKEQRELVNVKKLLVNIYIMDIQNPLQIPTQHTGKGLMKTDGNLLIDIEFAKMDSEEIFFNKVLSNNETFCKLLHKDYYMYLLGPSRKIIPLPFHKFNYPNREARENICLDKNLIISYRTQSSTEKKEEFNKINGISHIDLANSDTDGSDTEWTIGFVHG